MSFQEKFSEISQTYVGLHVKYLLFSSDFNQTWIFSRFLEILKYQVSLKSDQCEPNISIRPDRQTDKHDEANSRFSQFCEHA
jgi:hypothetical protein